MRKTPKSSSRDHLTKTTQKGKIELTEEEMTRVTGGTSQKIQEQKLLEQKLHGGWDLQTNKKY